MRFPILACLAACALSAGASVPAQAQDLPQGFAYGPVFTTFGPHAPAPEADFAIPDGAEFRVAFDVSTGADGEERNRGFESAARFMNMLAANGVAQDDIHLAVIVHGAAVRDLLTDEARNARDYGERNPSGEMVRAMLAKGIRFIVCGQSTAGSGTAKDDLIPGVELALSAMMAHALLQQQGYTLNPF